MNKFRGLGVAMVTPFKEDKSIDEAALRKLTNFLIDNGVHYLVVQGTTGESPTLDNKEKQQTLDIVADENKGRLPIVFGIGGNNTKVVCDAFSKFDLTKVDAILSASPYYNKPTQEGIYQHYAAMSKASPKPIILYNVPGRTSSNLTAETTLRLANDFDNIIGVKEASGNMEQITKIIKDKPKDFLVTSGDDPIAMPLIASGCDGVISVIGNGFPKEFSNMVNAGLENNHELALKYHFLTFDMIPLLFAEGNPAGIKEVLKFKGICENHVRLPLVPVSNELANKIIAESGNIAGNEA
ncbi:MAG: 4-hydroxy-tetrahydrodipicolinate synthase [Crocinitomicaceae bacterium]|nr:4-hydroxy-tetrahydrodipicolinate synthase [Crocinitomicaceae bacterium]